MSIANNSTPIDNITMNGTGECVPNVINQVMAPIIITLCLASMITNGYIILLYRWIRRPLSTILTLTLGLAAADFWTSTAMTATFTMNSFLISGLCFNIPHSDCVSLGIEVLRLGSIFTSILHLLLISLNHLLVILFPRPGAFVMNNKLLAVVFLSIWVIPPAIYFIVFSSVTGQGFQAPGCPLGFTNTFSFRLAIYISLLIPVIIMAVCYIVMISLLHKVDTMFSQQRKTRNTSSHSTYVLWRTLKTTMLMLGSFLMGWLPSGTVYLLACDLLIPYTFANVPFAWRLTIAFSVNFLMILKFFINPIIYSLRIPEIQEVLRRPAQACCPSIFKSLSRRYAQSRNETNSLVGTRPPAKHRRRLFKTQNTSFGFTTLPSLKQGCSNHINNDNAVNLSPAGENGINHTGVTKRQNKHHFDSIPAKIVAWSDRKRGKMHTPMSKDLFQEIDANSRTGPANSSAASEHITNKSTSNCVNSEHLDNHLAVGILPDDVELETYRENSDSSDSNGENGVLRPFLGGHRRRDRQKCEAEHAGSLLELSPRVSSATAAAAAAAAVVVNPVQNNSANQCNILNLGNVDSTCPNSGENVIDCQNFEQTSDLHTRTDTDCGEAETARPASKTSAVNEFFLRDKNQNDTPLNYNPVLESDLSKLVRGIDYGAKIPLMDEKQPGNHDDISSIQKFSCGDIVGIESFADCDEFVSPAKRFGNNINGTHSTLILSASPLAMENCRSSIVESGSGVHDNFSEVSGEFGSENDCYL